MSSTAKALAILRIGLFIFMLIWALEKFIRPQAYQAIFGYFYGLDMGIGAIYAIGAIQTLILLAFVAGCYKSITYGLVLAMNLITLAVSYRQILAPYQGDTNHLFAASIAVAAACLALFIARESDVLLAFGGAKRNR